LKRDAVGRILFVLDAEDDLIIRVVESAKLARFASRWSSRPQSGLRIDIRDRRTGRGVGCLK
jgi:hypothetical protein